MKKTIDLFLQETIEMLTSVDQRLEKVDRWLKNSNEITTQQVKKVRSDYKKKIKNFLNPYII